MRGYVVSGLSRTVRAMPVDMRMHRGRLVMVVVVRVHVGVDERGPERPHLQGDRQARREQPTHHACIFPAWPGRVNLNSS